RGFFQVPRESHVSRLVAVIEQEDEAAFRRSHLPEFQERWRVQFGLVESSPVNEDRAEWMHTHGLAVILLPGEAAEENGPAFADVVFVCDRRAVVKSSDWPG